VKLIPVVMGITRVGSKSPYAYEETLKQATALRELIETIPSNVRTTEAQPTEWTCEGEVMVMLL
jgi:hypothetical protein